MTDRSRKKKRKRRHNDLEYVADPHDGVDKSAYLNMVVCHSIAVADELQFVKYLRKLSMILREDPKDGSAVRALSLFAGRAFMDV